jgi:hypothetical protein
MPDLSRELVNRKQQRNEVMEVMKTPVLLVSHGLAMLRVLSRYGLDIV